MGKLLLLKLAELVVVLFVVTLLSFLLLSLVPGNPEVRILGEKDRAVHAVSEALAQHVATDPLGARCGPG